MGLVNLPYLKNQFKRYNEELMPRTILTFFRNETGETPPPTPG